MSQLEANLSQLETDFNQLRANLRHVGAMLSHLDKSIENRRKLSPLEAPPGGPLGAKLGHLEAMLVHFGAIWGGHVASCFLFPFFLRFCALWAASWSELGRQVGPKLGQVGSKLDQVGARTRHVGPSWSSVGPSCSHLGDMFTYF